ncbi:hypothetical protein N7495_000390 [Penicillium taxi]|uniref:uncharacterized protein n=1 Tax=Penicillium taxi TaxID=168475 RepID=UPI00254511E5|nr:uncharacterized protein N7495_000390 [Penicillium taxi]KAJ5907708.1 hypothetical protein N7495_000390 [Penicillium taxi]
MDQPGHNPVMETSQSPVHGLGTPGSALSSGYLPTYRMSTGSESPIDGIPLDGSDEEMDHASADEMQLDTIRGLGTPIGGSDGVPVDAAAIGLPDPQRFINRLVNDINFYSSTEAPSPTQYRPYGPKHDENQFFEGEMKPHGPRMRKRMSEEEHAALTVLNDEELLVTYSLNSGRSIPQTRRRFQAKLLSGGDHELEEELYAERFVVPASKSHHVPGFHVDAKGPLAPESAMGLGNSTAYLVRGTWREIVDHDENGWWAPGQKKRSDHSGGMKRHLQHGGISLRSNPGSGGNSRAGSRSASGTR